MNSRAILYFLNLEIDLTKVTFAYKRPVWRYNGMPRATVNGGKLRVEFQTDQRIIRFFEEMTSDYFATYGENSTMPETKVVIYDANGYIIRTHKHLDVIIQRIKNIFISEDETPMMSYVVFTIGVQNYGTKHTEKWNISDSEPSPYKTPVVAQEKETFFVEKIEIENLDEGSTNSGENSKLGMIYDKEYTLKVTSFKNNKPPENLDSIKWSYAYSTENEVVVGDFKQTGKEITFKTDDLEFCGRNITFYAYIEDKSKEAELDVFHHYRFRWFDRKKVLQQAKNRKIKPWLVDQGGTSLCGMACIFYLLAKKDPNSYYDLVEELHKIGKTKYNNYTIEPNSSSHKLYDVKPSSNDHPNIPDADWITMAVTRNKESNFGYTGKIGQDASAINWSNIMKKLSEKLLAYNNVSTKGVYSSVIAKRVDARATEQKVDDINKQINNGHKLMLMIDSDLISDDGDTLFSSYQEFHWVVLEKVIRKIQAWNSKGKIVNNYDFKVYSWGTDNRYLKAQITWEHFAKNYYGYIKVK